MRGSLNLSLYRKCKSAWYEVSIFSHDTHTPVVGYYVDNNVQLLTPEGFPAGAFFLHIGVVLRAVQGDVCRMYRET